MTVWYSHEAWGWVVSVRFMANRQNDSVWMPKGEFKLALNPNPNPDRFSAGQGGGDARARVVNQA